MLTVPPPGRRGGRAAPRTQVRHDDRRSGQVGDRPKGRIVGQAGRPRAQAEQGRSDHGAVSVTRWYDHPASHHRW
jgi:hypothetical protein